MQRCSIYFSEHICQEKDCGESSRWEKWDKQFQGDALCFQVNLEKVQERWWEAVFVDEPKLSVRKMECSRPMTDLDDEAQAKIEQMMWDDHRKKQGLPTSEELVSVKQKKKKKKNVGRDGRVMLGQRSESADFSGGGLQAI